MEKYIFGKKSILEAYNLNKLIRVHTKISFPEISDFKAKGIEVIFHKDNKFFNQFNVNHQNIVGVIETKDKYFTEDISEFIENIESKLNDKKIILMLDEIQDGGNFGSILRTCSGFDVDGIIFKKDNQVQINDLVIKTSMGAFDSLNLLRVSNLSNTLDKLKKMGYWIVSTSLQEDSVDISKQKTNFDKQVLIVGNENNGVSKNLINKSDITLKIPMNINGVQSFNVSVSVGILLYYLKF